MKRIILITFSLLIIATPAFADFMDDFNSHAEFWGVAPVEEYIDETGVFYISGSVLISDGEKAITLGGTAHSETLAVACCALDSIEINETFIIAGRIFQTYLQALKSEDKSSYYALTSYKIKVYVRITDNMVYVSLVK